MMTQANLPLYISFHTSLYYTQIVELKEKGW